ncbi:MAG: DUF6588 family protein [Leeuwenhoekiella sp.]
MKRASLLGLLLFPLISFSQLNPEAILESVKHDAGVIFDAFLEPGTKSMMQASHGGWYRSAKSLEPFAFDVGLVGTAGFAPGEEQSFRISSLDFENTVTGVPDVNPTVLGDGPKSTITVTNDQLRVSYDFEMINGLKKDLPFGATPAAVLQVAMGLPLQSEVILRLTPKTTVREISAGSFGFGLKSELSPYFNLKEDSPLTISLFANYSRSKFTYDFEEKSPFEGENQNIESISNGYSVQGLFSLDYEKFSVYGAAGYIGSSSTVEVLGTYRYSFELGGFGNISVPFEDLVSLEYNPSSLRATLGGAFHIKDFHLFADVSVQRFSTLSAGVVYTFSANQE